MRVLAITPIFPNRLEPLFGLPISLPVKVEEIDQLVMRFTLTIDLKHKQRSHFVGPLTAVRMKKPGLTARARRSYVAVKRDS